MPTTNWDGSTPPLSPNSSATADLSPSESIDAAIVRLEAVEPVLATTVLDRFADARLDASSMVVGPSRPACPPSSRTTPTSPGSRRSSDHGRWFRRAAAANATITQLILGTGLIPIAKSRLPEFGLTSTTEFSEGPPVRNPWNPEHSAGGSSGGSAALVAAGVVPIGHANDGGGSIRIPAACCGLVGLKPSRGRLPGPPRSTSLPIDISVEGVLTRTVRDTARFFLAAEQSYRSPVLPPVGPILGPGHPESADRCVHRTPRRLGL